MKVDLAEVPLEFRSMIISMANAARQKWFEASTAYFSRAIVNRAVSIECQIAGFTEAQKHFEQRAVWLVAQGIYCSAKMHEIQVIEASEGRLK